MTPPFLALPPLPPLPLLLLPPPPLLLLLLGCTGPLPW
jgi:hypothetical protein